MIKYDDELLNKQQQHAFTHTHVVKRCKNIIKKKIIFILSFLSNLIFDHIIQVLRLQFFLYIYTLYRR